MGQAKQKLKTAYGARAGSIDGVMGITRFKHGNGHRVEFYLDGLPARDGYDAVRQVKRRFEKEMGFTDPELLWCVHVRGPDDLIPAMDYEDALKICDRLAESDAQHAGDASAPMLRAVPRLWPGSPQQYAEVLAMHSQREAAGASHAAVEPDAAEAQSL